MIPITTTLFRCNFKQGLQTKINELKYLSTKLNLISRLGRKTKLKTLKN
jgi:hypothetical protein